MIHVIYETQNPYTLFPSTYNWLGENRSHGCICFTTADSRWICEHCPLKTTVNVYESPVPSPFDHPAIKTLISMDQYYDPTDLNLPENQYIFYIACGHSCHANRSLKSPDRELGISQIAVRAFSYVCCFLYSSTVQPKYFLNTTLKYLLFL